MRHPVVRPLAAALLAAASGCASTPPVPPATTALRDLQALVAESAPDRDPSTVDLLLAPDFAYLEARGADAIPSLLRAVETVDRVLGPEAGLRFRVGGATLFPATPGSADDRRLLWEARLRLARGGCDAIAAFTGQRCGDRAGAAEPNLRLLLCADSSDPERNLLHEACHFFGAQDYARGHPGYGLPTVMSYDSDLPRTLDLDEPNLARIRSRKGRLPAAVPDPLALALESRLQELPAGAGAALLGGFLAAEIRSEQASGLAPAERFARLRPGDPVASWIEGECRRVLKQGDDAAALLLLALEGIAAKEVPDGLDRHAALEASRLAVDGTDGLAPLMPAAEKALERVDSAFPRDPEVLDLRASLRARAGDRAAAERLYDAAIDADPLAVYPWRHLAALGRSCGDERPWLEGWRGALAADPLDPVLAVRWVEDSLDAFPAALARPGVREEAAAALDAAERDFPGWTVPAALRARLFPGDGGGE